MITVHPCCFVPSSPTPSDKLRAGITITIPFLLLPSKVWNFVDITGILCIDPSHRCLYRKLLPHNLRISFFDEEIALLWIFVYWRPFWKIDPLFLRDPIAIFCLVRSRCFSLGCSCCHSPNSAGFPIDDWDDFCFTLFRKITTVETISLMVFDTSWSLSVCALVVYIYIYPHWRP